MEKQNPLPERIAAAIDRYGIYTHDDTTRGLTIPCSRTLAARDDLISLFAEVVAERDSWMSTANVKANEAQQLRAERDAAIANASLPGYCRLVDERDVERARADGLASERNRALVERNEAQAELDELRTEWFGIAGGEQSFPSDRTGDAMAQHQVDAWLADGQKARADLAAAQAKLAELLAAAKEAEEVLALMERPRIEDPSYGAEVRELGDRIGFGALMSSASASWRKRLEASGGPVGGEHCAGPCHATVLMTLKVVRAAIAAAEQGGA